MGTAEYGSKQYSAAQEDFQKIQNQLEATQKEWEDIQKKLDGNK